MTQPIQSNTPAPVQVVPAVEKKETDTVVGSTKTTTAPTTVETAQTASQVANDAINAKGTESEEKKTDAPNPDAAKSEVPENDAPKADTPEGKTYSEKISDGFSSAWDSVKGAGSSAKEGIENLGGNVKEGTMTLLNSLRYKELDAIGQITNRQAYDTISGGWESFTTSRAITWVRETADSAANTVSDNAPPLPPASSWAPAVVFAAGACTAYTSLKAAANNLNAGNLKRAVCQIFVGTAGLALAGGIAYGSPVGESAANGFSSFFKKEEA